VKHPVRWTLKWVSLGDTHIMWHECQPLLFRTKREARDYAEREYGYIKERQDLRMPPHNWRMPKPVRVDVILRLHGGT
jgi:hypothetical protein